MGKNLVFTDKGSGCILGDHEAGVQARMSNEEGREPTEGVVDGPFQTTFRNVGNFRKTNTKEVKRKGHRFTMEVASGDDCAIRQDNGVIRSGVDFDINLFFDKAQGILAGAVDLRYAAEGVRILNLQFPLMGNVGRVFRRLRML